MNMNPQVQQTLGQALAISEAVQPAVAIANPNAGIALGVANAAAQYVSASMMMHAAGAVSADRMAADWSNAAAAVAAGAAAFNAAHPAAGAIVAAAAMQQAPVPTPTPTPTPTPGTLPGPTPWVSPTVAPASPV
jgi:hypothetical protein